MSDLKKATGNTTSITVDGHPVRLTFAKESNPQISRLVRDCLIDSYIRQRKRPQENAKAPDE